MKIYIKTVKMRKKYIKINKLNIDIKKYHSLYLILYKYNI